MKYEQFLADVVQALAEVDFMGRTLSRVKSVLSATHDLVEKNGRLEKENAELRDELDDWKGNAEGFQPDAYMKLPLDADGVPIRIGDKVNVDGEAMAVLGYRLHNGTLFLIVKESGSIITYSPRPSSVRHFKYVPPDSWEKLEEDANLGCRDYCEKHRLEECDYNMRVHLLARAKKLAGIEEEAQR